MGDKVKRLAILGSTGSIGRQTIDVVRAFPGIFRIIGLTAGQNHGLLAQQIEEFQPRFVHCQQTQAISASASYQVLPPEEIASYPEVDTVVIAISGQAGLSPVLAAVRAGKNIALSNKESLVTAGEIIMAEAKAHSATILPVDSEHSAIWQCLQGEKREAASIILTASGGPFRGYTEAEMEKVTAAQALQHPSWQMGKKVTIDSATLMNKGLEVIEARWLFDVPFDRIRVLVHPQSIVHSMVEFADGSIKAQLGYPDMRLPIQYALTYPERLDNPGLPRLDWSRTPSLTFEQPDFDSFPCLKLAIEAGKKGGTYPAVLCTADEVAVDLFLAGSIKFTDIARLIKKALDEHRGIPHPTLEQIRASESWTRRYIANIVSGED
jgi:1-deoxy-D-xylulose-5-phosphate reductoisomerase